MRGLAGSCVHYLHRGGGGAWAAAQSLAPPLLPTTSACAAAASAVTATPASSCTRHNSTQSSEAGPPPPPPPPLLPLKAALRRLYLRVHPDRFGGWPAEKAENERSFALLQQYLAAARGGRDAAGGAAPGPGAAYHFRFYLHPSDGGGDGDGGGGGGSGDKSPPPEQPREEEEEEPPPPPPPPRLVELSLAPPEPARGGGGGGDRPLSPAARKALARLMALVGVRMAADARDGDAAEDGGARGLLDFLPEAAEALRRAEASAAAGADVEAANIRGALRVARGVIAGFGAPHAAPGPRQVALLRGLVRALDELAAEGIEVAGAHVMFGDRTAMDARGTLWLDASDDPPDTEAWADALGGADWGHAAALREAAAAVRRLEQAAAGAAGLAAVLAPAALAPRPEYRQFLERLAAHAAAHGPVLPADDASRQQSDSNFGEVPLYVAPIYSVPTSPNFSRSSSDSNSNSSSSSNSDGFELREAAACLQVPVAAGAAQVYAFVRARGADARAAVQARRAAAEREEALGARVRARLGLRRLARDAARVSQWQFEAGCGRLLQHAAVLQRHLEGANVRISDANRVDGRFVCVAWNAEP